MQFVVVDKVGIEVPRRSDWSINVHFISDSSIRSDVRLFNFAGSVLLLFLGLLKPDVRFLKIVGNLLVLC